MNTNRFKDRPNGQFFPKGTYLDFGTKLRRPEIDNPYMRDHSIQIRVKRFFTDVNGTIINKNAAPLPMQVEYPFYLFGDFDRQGGYSIGLKTLGPVSTTKYLMTFVNGHGLTSAIIIGFTGANTIQSQLAVGDIIHVFCDDTQNPTFFVWVVLHNGFGSLASIIGNSETTQQDGLIGPIYVKSFHYASDNVRQFDYPYYFVRYTNITAWKNDQVQPMMFKDPFTEQEKLLNVQVEFGLDQYLGIAQYFLFDTEIIDFNFKIKITV